MPHEVDDHRPARGRHRRHHGHTHEATPSPGHNRTPQTATQWEMPAASQTESADVVSPPEPDFDLVEKSFIEAAVSHSDPTSFLRLASVKFAGQLADGRTAHLLGFHIDHLVEVGSVSPAFSAEAAVYHPLPAARIRKQSRLRFQYWTHDGEVLLSLAEARQLKEPPL